MPEPLQLIGRYLVAVGAVVLVVGLVLMVAPRIPFIGKLPGDIHIRKEGLEVYIPLATSLLLSLLISLGFWLYQYFTKK